YTYFLYIMGSSSRGAYMPRYGGMLWYTTGDMRQWGSQFWWHNQGCYYNGLAPANRFELLDPVFSTYSSAIDSYALAAKQQWGSQGIWIPETTWFDGLENLPDDITAEMRDLYLARKPWEQRSQAFRDFSQRKQIFNARWNWLHYSSEPWKNGQLVSQNWPTAPFAYVTHIFSSTAKIAYVYWLRYQYTEDKTFLRNRAYPVIKGAAEFYRNFPNMRKGDDGKFHITHISNHESNWNSNDSIEELTAMHAILPMAISAAKTLGMDTDLQEKWKDLYANLAPIPTGIVPSEFYDMCTVGTGDREMLDRLRALPTRRPINAETRLGVLSREAIAAANLGLADRIKFMIPGQMMTTNENIDSIGVGPTGVGVMRNRLGMREGPGCLECQRLGNASYALHSALLQSVPPTMDGDPVIYVFPAWPKEWDAQYTLAARGAFLVSASMEGGEIKLVEIHSQLGGKCRLSNPWPEQTVTLYRNGKKGEQLSGGLLDFSTQVDEIVAVVMGNNTPSLQRVR
ncbi:MAG TPA: hypothetical protein VHS31_19475, partial [Tepidisphaeraceae bacterium]|nr:hypothetical protein [Tepidisphaeraceae bacterium]